MIYRTRGEHANYYKNDACNSLQHTNILDSIGNPGFGQAQKCDGVKKVTGIPTLFWKLDLQCQYGLKQ